MAAWTRQQTPLMIQQMSAWCRFNVHQTNAPCNIECTDQYKHSKQQKFPDTIVHGWRLLSEVSVLVKWAANVR